MAQVDVEWPSEDEDFDATTGAVGDVTDFDEAPEEATAEPESAAPASVEPAETEAEPAIEEAEPQAEAQDESQEPEPAPIEEHMTDPIPEESAPEPVPEQYEAPAKLPKRDAPTSTMGRTILEFVLVIVLIVLGLWAWSLYSDNKDLKQQVSQLNANPQVAVQKQTESLINNVSKLMQLPTGETPTVASVSDASQAKEQSAFFNNAKNGDKVLMYVKAGEAILYRPSTNKIILVAPLTFTGSGSSASTNSTATTPKTSSTNP